MQRRHIISLAGFSLLTGLVGENLTKSLTKSLPSTREVTIFFPQGKTFQNFQADLSQWMNVTEWKSFLKREQDRNSIAEIQRRVYSDRVVYKYRFNNFKDLAMFRPSAHAETEIDLAKLASLGYSESVRIS